jgi:HNH endonuclease
MVQSRSSKGTLFSPATGPTHTPEYRAKWLEDANGGFVAPGEANHRYYSLILELLWPAGHGLPGPQVKESEIRACLDRARRDDGKHPYRDPFRRMRELQGDEGFKSILKSGISYQLQSTSVSPKREPRSRPKASLWREIRNSSDGTCAKCGLKEPDIKLSPDHRIPRSRGGSGDDFNWQPLCHQCNILKSAACQGCQRLCNVCYWAYPENYSQLDIDDHYREAIKSESVKRSLPQNEILRDILNRHFRKY